MSLAYTYLCADGMLRLAHTCSDAKASCWNCIDATAAAFNLIELQTVTKAQLQDDLYHQVQYDVC